tara:strand:+ start:1288 stop:1920 length:633 start_codon:yes stop_codon:yes gene_type:complete
MEKDMNNLDVKIVIENAPPKAGKDTVADKISYDYRYCGMNRFGKYNVTTASFKEELIKIALCVSGIPLEEWNLRYTKDKDTPWDKLGGLSQRQYLIKISEEWVKPVHGEKFFGDKVVQHIESNNHAVPSLYLIPDGGFEEEVLPLIDRFGAESILILQWEKEGCSFENDSRDWILNYPEITRYIGENKQGELDDFADRFVDTVAWFLGEQ